jgi:transcription-repair coupling factor (superfamily II helicase)
MAKALSPSSLASKGIRLEVGSETSRDGLISKLRANGYFREDPVGEVGEFSFRGGIVDFFSPSQEHPVRIEFFGDEVESIRDFDPATQRSVDLIGECELAPMREICVSKAEIADWHRSAPEYWNQVQFARALEQHMQFTENGELFNGFEFLFPLVLDTSYSIFDYLSSGPDGFSLIVTEPDEVFSEGDRLWERAKAGYEDSWLDGALALPPDRLLFSPEWLRKQLKEQRVFQVEKFARERTEVERIDFRSARHYGGSIRDVLADLKRWSEADEHVVFVMSSSGMADRLAEILREYDVFASVHPEGFEEALQHPIGITVGSISNGFHAAEFGFHLATQEQVFGERKGLRPPAKSVKREAVGAFLSDFRDLHDGDYVVHIDHGIGLFRGLQSIGVGEKSNEFVVLEYKEGAKLYVPVDRLDLVQKFSSGGKASPQIDRLGGTSWAKTKSRIKKSMRKLAEDLLKLYARREVAEGHAFAPDDDLMREFEDAFEFQETPDQMAAIEACKKDMEAGRPMDRLVCGDVGYGKTEVAMRVAFKAVSDGKQVAVLAPTTVLAFQHLNTFSERMKAFPVKVEMVSRFISKPEQKKVLERARLGLVDVRRLPIWACSSSMKSNALG